ncbi:alpha/beta hydrolase [Jatrophihabitans endophyticus]|uniref:alpha/beta hydrolase n=1 Tax=Jatrophihabitans endophyticus TaxID=1206085 RepID=UPI001A01ABE4|nr:alpha/beta fold hydrolase [Jatrophihabitans endophyticus]MBE7186792.1 alpha/beta fold hydrolase [Jatrophihabitans endophyticus]
MSEVFLRVDEPAGAARAVALVLHGGRSTSTAPVRANQLAVLRMLPFVGSLRRAGAQHGLAVARLRYRVRGWNGAERSPVADVESVLDRLVTRFPDVPIALVGHSMGGRAALYAAGHDAVRSVVGLAPWVEPGDPMNQLLGRRLLVAHGRADRMTDPRESARYTAAAAAVAASASYVAVDGDRHAMLRRAALWHGLATGFVLATLLDVAPGESVGGDPANLVVKALDGTAEISA